MPGKSFPASQRELNVDSYMYATRWLNSRRLARRISVSGTKLISHRSNHVRHIIISIVASDRSQ